MAELFLVERRSVVRNEADGRPPDWPQREAALDIRHSAIVEAPAGSGKTGLLIQRLLKLLGDRGVTEPEQVMAITFTVKATAELRDRVLKELDAAASGAAITSDFARETRALAEAVLARDRTLSWGLRERPERLRIRTIDSVCAEIARALPVLSGSGGLLAPVPDAGPLHREAARRTLMHLGGDDPVLNDALRTVLLHRDGNLAECERLLAEMLQWRDQWGTLVPLSGEELSDAALDATVLPRLETALDRAICSGLQQLAKSIPSEVLEALTFLASEMGHADGYQGEVSPIALCASLKSAPGETADHLGHWRALIHLMTTGDGSWRRGFRSNWLQFTVEPRHAARLKTLVEGLTQRDDLLQGFKQVRCLPPARYPPEQWTVVKSLFRLLRRALVELQLVFSERAACDFTELGLLARTALRKDEDGDDLAASLGMRLQHLLVDEMQDTSTSQYELIERLTAGWDGRSQTVFLVGDPKQSIYLFRQARVERFTRTMRTGKLGDLPLCSLQLSANFRSQRALVDHSNQDFSLIFPPPDKDRPLPPATPPSSRVPPPVIRPTPQAEFGTRTPSRPLRRRATAASARQIQARANAAEVRRIVEGWRARPCLPAAANHGASPSSSARAITSPRSPPPLKETAPVVPIPFRAVDIEPLNERPRSSTSSPSPAPSCIPPTVPPGSPSSAPPGAASPSSTLHRLAGADDRRHKETTSKS